MLTAAAYDIHVNQLLERMRKFHACMDRAGIPYRIIGGMATFIQIFERDPHAGRLTDDVDAAVNRSDLDAIIRAAEAAGFKYRHVAGVDMLLDAKKPKAKSAIHLVFIGEKVRPEYLETIPGSPPEKTKEGILIAPVRDLVVMKLTSFRIKDQLHIQDLDGVGLITPEIEAQLSEPLQQRLAQVRSSR